MESEGSVEYQILVRHTAELQEAVNSNVTRLGAKLLSRGIINRDQYGKIREQKASDERAADLIDVLQGNVKNNSHIYRQFISILEQDWQLYGDVITMLQETFIDLKKTASSNDASVSATAAVSNASESTDGEGNF